MAESPPGRIELPAGLRRERVTIEHTWSSTPVETQVPNVGKYTQSIVSFVVRCESAQILLALVVRSDDRLRFGRLRRSDASNECLVRLSFGSYKWHQSDMVDVALSHGSSFAQLRVDDHLLKTGPRRVTSILAESAAHTGAIWPLAVIDRVDLVAEIAIISKADTVFTHGRWRVSESLDDVPERYRFLLTGAVSG